MRWPLRLLTLAALAVCSLHMAGCGTTRATDTTRAATEQLLISDAIDHAVQNLNLQTLGGQSVFLDDSRLSDVVDKNYLISTLRQQLLASGCLLREQKDQADFIIEARAGAIGTDRNDLLFGIPSMNVPQIPLVQPVPAAIPEIPIAKRRDQRGIAKIAVFVYHRETGTPVWQSGLAQQESSANDIWILGAGPFQRGTVYEGTEFAGKSIRNGAQKSEPVAARLPAVEVGRESLFTSPQRLAKRTAPPVATDVMQAAHQEPARMLAPANASPIPLPSQASPSAGAAPPAAVPSAPAAAPATSTVTPVPNGEPKPQGETAAPSKTTPATPLPQSRFNSPL